MAPLSTTPLMLGDQRNFYLKRSEDEIGGSETTLPFTVEELILRRPMDSIDENPYYLNSWTGYPEYIRAIKNKFHEDLPKRLPEGKVVVLGAYKCESLDLLIEKYGSENCIGVDAVKYVDHPNLIIKDVRSLKPGDLGPISFGWSNVCSWTLSPRSKLAAFNFLKESLVPGGVFLDLVSMELPKDLNTNGFQLVKPHIAGTAWRKV